MLRKLILVAFAFGGHLLAQTYTQPFTTTNRTVMLGSTHGQGTTVTPGECWDNAAPQNKVVQLAGYPRRAANGDITWSWNGSKTGLCYAVGPAGGGGGGAIWGSITGVLSAQTDLQAALNLKAPLVAGVVPTVNLGSGTASITTFLRGDNTWAVPAGGGGGATTLPQLTDVDDAVVPTNRFTLVGNGTIFQGRALDATDILSGTFASARLGSGTATVGYVPISTGTGAPAWGPAPGGGGGSTWGTITGTLSSQTDLQSALDLKAPLVGGLVPTANLGSGSASGTTYLRGDGTWATPAGGGGATTLPQLTDVDDAVLPTNRHVLIGNGTIFQGRTLDATDIVSGTLLSSRIATGTATSGFIPISAGPGVPPAWGSVTGTGTVTSVGTGCGTGGGPITTTGTVRALISPTSTATLPYTMVPTDCGKLYTIAGSGGVLTLPTIDGTNIAAGWYVYIQNRSVAGNVVITPATNNIDATGALTLTPGQGVMVSATGTAYWSMRGMGTGAGGGGGSYVGGPDGCITVNTATDPDQLDFDIECLLTESYAWTGSHNFTGALMIIPNSTTLPPTCTPGQLYMDTDGTSGARYNGCDATNTWLPLGGGAGGTPTQITVADTTDTTSSVALFESPTGNLPPKTDGGLTYNAGTGMLTATGFTGPLTGTASLATALAANGANCPGGQYPAGVNASGAVEGCTAAGGLSSQMMLANPGTAPTASATSYNYLAGSAAWNTSQNVRYTAIPIAGVFSLMKLRISAPQGAGGTLVCSLYVNGSPQALSVTLAADAPAGIFNDNTNSVTVAADDLVAWQCVQGSSATTTVITSISAKFQQL